MTSSRIPQMPCVFCKNKDAEIASLKAESERLKKELAEWQASKSHMIDIIHDSTAPFLARAEAAEQENNRLYKQLADQHNTIDQLRKVVWWLEKSNANLTWTISFKTEAENNLKIADLQRGMGK